jgi:hypothetical protein
MLVWESDAPNNARRSVKVGAPEKGELESGSESDVTPDHSNPGLQ